MYYEFSTTTSMKKIGVDVKYDLLMLDLEIERSGEDRIVFNILY